MQKKNKNFSRILFITICITHANLVAAANSRHRTSASPDEESSKGDEKDKLKKKDGKDERGSTGKNEKNSTSMKNKAAAAPSGTRRFGIGLDLGSNATYGNALLASFNLAEFLNVQGGIGYNTSGLKMGAGAAVVIPLGRFGFDAGGAFVHSNGTKDKVSLPAKFTPEGSSTEENVTVTKTYTLTPANYISGFGGFFFDIVPAFRVLAHVNFNKVLSGNEVAFDGTAQYDDSVDASNDAEVETDFDPKAKKKLDISGLGFSIGLQYRF